MLSWDHYTLGPRSAVPKDRQPRGKRRKLARRISNIAERLVVSDPRSILSSPEVAESEGKQVLMLVMTAKKFLTMMTGAYGDELKKQLMRPQVFDFEKKIIDFSEVGDNQNESTADLAIRLFTKMLEKEMCFIPGGLFRGAFSGVGIPIIMKQKPMEEDQIRLFRNPHPQPRTPKFAQTTNA
jgi:hypothetical protein